MGRRGQFIGLMSGTSVDAIDAALVEFSNGNTRLIGHHSEPLDTELRGRIHALSRGTAESVHELCALDNELGRAFADASLRLLEHCDISRADVTAIGSHGQTVRHRPARDDGPRYTLQIGDPNVIAELTGICTVADFRRRDMAAGGEGAPLVPPFHADAFGVAGTRRAIINIGGIANVTLLDGTQVVAGFDCGPGNTLLDAWVARHLGKRFDADGAWAAEHVADHELLARLLEDPFFSRTGPRSTGPEHFNPAWLEKSLAPGFDPGRVQATLAELTATAIADSLPLGAGAPDDAFVCGGGARNSDLMRRLQRLLDARGIALGKTDELGIAAEWVEASAFAWLAQRTVNGLAGNAPEVTGARGERILGAIYGGALPRR